MDNIEPTDKPLSSRIVSKMIKRSIEANLLEELIDQCNQPPHVINKSELERLLNERIKD